MFDATMQIVCAQRCSRAQLHHKRPVRGEWSGQRRGCGQLSLLAGRALVWRWHSAVDIRVP